MRARGGGGGGGEMRMWGESGIRLHSLLNFKN